MNNNNSTIKDTLMINVQLKALSKINRILRLIKEIKNHF